MLKKIPVSLRFDDDETGFYYNFIMQKRNDRELSSLIVDLLHVYYESEEVREVVDNYIINNSPYMQIQQQLERIAVEHSKNTASTSMLSDFQRNARRKFTETSENIKEDTFKSSEKEEREQAEENKEMYLPESALKHIDDTLDKHIVDAVSRVLQNPTNMEAILKAAMKENKKNYMESQQINTMPENIQQNIVSPMVEENRVSPIIPQEQRSIPINIPNEVVDRIENTPKKVEANSGNRKPASFSKLLKSVQ